MPKNNYKKIFIYAGLFLISLFAFPNISQAIDIPASASRTSGVAPLSVHFNADLTASSPTERSFHDLEYSWNFGDANAGNWGTDNKPKNQDKGPVSAHVYEIPGTFTATLNVRNATGIIDTKTFEITVDDPDVFYLNTTMCISTGVDFTGCPSGATQITTSDLSSLPNYTVTNNRILFKRGDSWIAPSGLYPDYPANSQNVHIGAFGSCSNPDSMGICSNAPEITVNGTGTFINLHNTQNWRIVDLSFAGAKDVYGVLGGNINIRRLLVSRLKTRGFYVPIGNGHWRGNDDELITENIFIANDVRDSGEYCFFGGGDRFALMGNQFHNADTSHVTRVWWDQMGLAEMPMMSRQMTIILEIVRTLGKLSIKLNL